MVNALDVVHRNKEQLEFERGERIARNTNTPVRFFTMQTTDGCGEVTIGALNEYQYDALIKIIDIHGANEYANGFTSGREAEKNAILTMMAHSCGGSTQYKIKHNEHRTK